MHHGEIKASIQSRRTVAPQSHALAISGLTATSITTTLRMKAEKIRARGGQEEKVFHYM